MMTARTRPVCRYCGLRYQTNKHEPFCSKRCALNHERECNRTAAKTVNRRRTLAPSDKTDAAGQR